MKIKDIEVDFSFTNADEESQRKWKKNNNIDENKTAEECFNILKEEYEIKGNVCLLDKIQDPGNLGTIIRSAVAFKIDTIILSQDTVDLYNDKVIRASEGMIFHLNIIRGDLKEYINLLKKDNYTIYGTDCLLGTNIKDISFKGLNAIIIGNEGKGIDENIKKLCDEHIHIPIVCESLNAGVAASIIFYEIANKC